MNYLPENKTEAEVVEIIQRIARRLASNFVFGCFTVEDIRQQACLFACQGLKLYDSTRPLENFLFTHVRNRLINFKRDNYKRTDCPCAVCYGKLSGDTDHEDRQYCEKFLIWQKRNIRKQNVLSPLDIGNISDENEQNTRMESTVVLEAEISEILEKIDRELPIDMRAQYLQMKEGISVPKAKRKEIEDVVNNILGGNLYDYSTNNSY